MLKMQMMSIQIYLRTLNTAEGSVSGDKQQNCSIRLSHVTKKDEHMYYFRFITDKPDVKWLGTPGVSLTVTDDTGRLVILYISIGVIGGAAAIITMLMIW
ncbi:hypothetical protein QQF64_000150 [Cirrhinus molitorella]|uniref:B-cell receptor CD22 first Ig-like domain-containing protein n=1 Tax=Cirrhinus molitorella TaxID=172907 RepID=A0ABR3NWX6_9TELE